MSFKRRASGFIEDAQHDAPGRGKKQNGSVKRLKASSTAIKTRDIKSKKASVSNDSFKKKDVENVSAREKPSVGATPGRSLEGTEVRVTPHSPVMDEAESHARELELLKETDPEFYKFLLENDKELLNFGNEVDATCTGETVPLGSHTDSENGFSRGDRAETPEEEELQVASRPSVKGYLTDETFEHLLSSAVHSTSLRSLILVLGAFRGAVRSVADYKDEVRQSAIDASEAEVDQKNPLLRSRHAKINAHLQRSGVMAKDTSRKPLTKAGSGAKQQPSYLFALKLEGGDSDARLDEAAMTLMCSITMQTLQNAGTLLDTRFMQQRQGEEAPGKAAPATASLVCQLKSLKTLSKVTPRQAVFLNHFWADVTVLLRLCHSLGKDAPDSYLETILLHLTAPGLLKWLAYTRSAVLEDFLKSVVNLWLEARRCGKEKSGPLSAFLVLRQISLLVGTPEFHAIAGQLDDELGHLSAAAARTALSDKTEESQQALLTLCNKHYLRLIERIGLSWKYMKGLDVLTRCWVQLVCEANSSVSYRVCYLVLRQLGIILRNYMVLNARGPKKEAAAKQKAHHVKKVDDATKTLFNWKFLYSCRTLVEVCGRRKEILGALCFPLSSILSSCIKISFSSMTYAPFALECFRLQCLLMETADVYVPLGSYLVHFGSSLVDLQDRVALTEQQLTRNQLRQSKKASGHKGTLRNPTHVSNTKRNFGNTTSSFGGNQSKGPPAANSTTVTRVPDLDTAIRITRAQLELSSTAELLISRWMDTIVNYLGLLALHPSFPEVVVPLTVNLKRLAKCKSDITRQEIKRILAQCETTATEVRQKRFALNPQKMDVGVFQVFKSNDITLAKARAARLKAVTDTLRARMDLEEQRRMNNDETNPSVDDPHVSLAEHSEGRLASTSKSSRTASTSFASKTTASAESAMPDRDSLDHDDSSNVEDLVEEFDLNSSDEDTGSDSNNEAGP